MPHSHGPGEDPPGSPSIETRWRTAVRHFRRQWIGAVGATALAAGAVSLVSTGAQAAPAPTAPVVINEVYGGGGNLGALYDRDFVELVNVSSAPVNLTGWSVQYTSTTG